MQCRVVQCTSCLQCSSRSLICTELESFFRKLPTPLLLQRNAYSSVGLNIFTVNLHQYPSNIHDQDIIKVYH